MNALPSSIETALTEAGFSMTEILILKRLLENDALGLRDLAIRTGKSTGVLDQALKKLLKKGIVSKEIINESPKYTLHSLQAVQRWMEEDMREKREMLLRKQRNFDSFIATLTKSKERPDMEHFEGLDGIKQAYVKLLDKGREFLQFFPVICREEDDVLRDFRVQYFRERRRRGIFSRIITHDVPLGRRFQSRDVFEYRKTLLVDRKEYPFIFEQIVVDGTIACFDHTAQKACFVHFPQLAEGQRLLFESIWRAAEHGRKPTKEEMAAVTAIPVSAPMIPLPTRTLSMLRELFLSRRGLMIMALSAVVAGAIAYGFYRRNYDMSLQRVQERVQFIASTGALQFDARDFQELQREEDWRKPQWGKVVQKLKDIRINNEDVLFVYLFRRLAEDPQKLIFVADSHSIHPYANMDDDPTNNVDVNGDGIISGPDMLQWPGQEYPAPPFEALLAFEGPTASRQVYEDSWGAMISGYAPIRDMQGNVVAVLAADIAAGTLQKLAGETLRPFLYFVFLFFVFLLIRLAAFNRPLCRELLQAFNIRSLPTLLLFAALLSGSVTYGLYQHNLRLHFQRMQEQVKSIAATGAFQFDPNDLNALQVKEDWKKPEWKKVVKQLMNIRENNKNVVFAYILRTSTSDPTKMEFVSDSHSLNPYAKIDLNGDGLLDENDELNWPGQAYDDAPAIALRAYDAPIVDDVFYTDQWGTFIGGYAPIRTQIGTAVAILGIDMRAEKLAEFTQQNFHALFIFIIFFLLFLFLEIAALNSQFLKHLPRILQ